MSRQLAISSAFSVFALSALALLAPAFAHPGAGMETGAPTEIAAPALPTMPALVETFAD